MKARSRLSITVPASTDLSLMMTGQIMQARDLNVVARAVWSFARAGFSMGDGRIAQG